MTSQKKGVLYTGVTNDLIKRGYQHKNDLTDGFTKKYKVHKFVYYEQTENIDNALEREKRIKKWKREWKIRLIENLNPDWNDLYQGLI